MTSTAPFLRGVYLVPERVPEGAGYPFSVPALSGLSLSLSSPVTFFIGENGSGKSTLIEALAVVCGLSPSGGGKNEVGERFGTQDQAPLASALRPQFTRRPSDSFFFRAETLAHFATLLEDRKRDPDFLGDPYARYGGRSLHERSHGEAFLAAFQHRLGAGLWLIDEPEAALSPQRQLALLALMHDRVRSGQTQLIIATHSPILMTFPGAEILELTDQGIRPTSLTETSHYQITRGILAQPESYWRHLTKAPADEGD